LVHPHFWLTSPLHRSPTRPKNKTNTTTKHSPNKEPTTQLVLSNYKIISADNMQENNQEKKIATTHHTFFFNHHQLPKALLYSTFND
jgi:hypothetical protein